MQCAYPTLARSACDALSRRTTSPGQLSGLLLGLPLVSHSSEPFCAIYSRRRSLLRTASAHAVSSPVFSARSPAASLHPSTPDAQASPYQHHHHHHHPPTPTCLPLHTRSRPARRRIITVVARMRRIGSDLFLDFGQAAQSHGALQHQHHVIYTAPDRHTSRPTDGHALAAAV